MRAIAALTEQENRALTRLAEEARQDTKLTKAVSVLAALYLPASLVAVGQSVHLPILGCP